jgi:hypothetical protein
MSKSRELKTLMGTCKWCHQRRIVKAPWDTPQNELDEIASYECACPSACLAYERRTAYSAACDHINKVCNQSRVKCKSIEMLTRWNLIELLAVMIAGMTARVDAPIRGASIDLDANHSLIIKRNQKGKVKVKWTYKDDEESNF